MQQEARIRKNNRIMEEFGISGLSIDLRTLSRKKTTPKGQSPSSKGKRSGRDGCHGEGSDLSYYIPELRSLMMDMMIRT
jgi:hypothetical protein